MSCDPYREALSALLDGEASPVEADVLDAHVQRCPGCTAWVAELGGLHRMVRVRAAETIPDLTAPILAAAPAVARPAPIERISTTRWALFVVALTQLLLAAPALLFGEDAGASMHVARELGSFDVALAVGFLVAAWQPARAWGLLPVAAALGLVMALTAAVDLVGGTATTVGEAHHLLDLAGLGLLWVVAREPHARTASAHRLAAS